MKFLKSLVLAMLLTLFYGQAYAIDASVVNMEEGQTVTGVIVDRTEIHKKRSYWALPGPHEILGFVVGGAFGHPVTGSMNGRALDDKYATALKITVKTDDGKGYYALSDDKDLQVGDRVEVTSKGEQHYDVKVLARAKAEPKDDTAGPSGNEVVVSQPDTRN